MPPSISQDPDEPVGLLRILAAAFSGFLFGVLLPKLKAPSNEPINSTSPMVQIHDQSSRVETHTPLIHGVSPSEPNFRETYECYSHKTPRWKIILGWLMFAATAGAFVAAAYYASITRAMWVEMQKQTVNSERAWLGLDGSVNIDALQFEPPHLRMIAHFRVKNFGHGPAFKVFPIGFVETDYKTLGAATEAWCKNAIAFASGTVPVGPGLTQPAARGEMLFPDQWRDEWIGAPGAPFASDSLPEMKKFWLVGCIAYFDQFKSLHWTRFCITSPDFGPAPPMNKDIPLHPCSLYNDTDDSEHGDDKHK